MEPGGQSQDEGGIYGMMTSGWDRLSSSPMYRVGVAPTTWSDASGGYFARTSSPGFMQGQYLPSKESQKEIKEYINDQIAQANFRARAYVFDAQNKKHPKRGVFYTH